MIYSKFMEWDARMMSVDKQTGEIIKCKVQSMQLPEQLSEIDHIFSDKTGTLTQNELLFGAVTVDGKVCEGGSSEEILNKVTETGSPLIELLFKCFCLCNECSFIHDPLTNKEHLQGSSQDEILLLEVAQKYDHCKLIARTQTKFVLSVKDA